MSKFTEITNGWYNYLTQNSDFKPEAERRASICAGCKLNINNVCSRSTEDICVKTFEYHNEVRIEGNSYKGCGCALSAKTFSVNTQCPLNKWEHEKGNRD